MFSFSWIRPNGVAAKRSIGRSLSHLGLFACFIAVAGAGCGGGTDYSEDGPNGPGTVTTPPAVVANAPQLSVEGTRGQVVILATSNYTPGDDLSSIPLNPQQLKVTSTQSVGLNYPESYTLIAPEFWADRKFKEWQLNGNVIETERVLPFVQIPPSLNGSLKAIYEPYILPAGENFAPNYLADLVDTFPRPTLPIKLWLDPLLTPNDGARQLLLEGLNKWVNASGGVITFNYVRTAGEADIRLRSADSLPNLPPYVLGIAIPQVYVDSINQVDNTRDVTDVYLIRSQIAGQGSIDRAQYVSTVTHEMGHALGMIGHSSDPNDIMYPTIGPLEVSQKDINTVATLYRSYFDGGNTIP